MATEVEWAWAAGLFEGEGSIIYGPFIRYGRPATRRRLGLEMTDEDIVRRFAAIVDAGSVRVSKRQNRVNRENHHIIWIWNCGRWEDIERILTEFLPYLGHRRRTKAVALLADPAGPIGRQAIVTPAMAAAIRESPESLNALALRYGLRRETIGAYKRGKIPNSRIR